MNTCRSFLGLLGGFALAATQLGADTTITVQADQPGALISSNLFGIFFEEINYGGDGGVYAELVRNRTFGNSTSPDFWTLVTSGTASGTMAVDTSQPLNANNPRSLFLSKASGSGGSGAANSGYWGIALQSGATYDLSFYARGSNGFSGPVIVRLESADGSQVFAQASFSGITSGWQKFTAALVSSGTATDARIVLSLTNAASVWLDDVSLFPRATFNGRPNGMRPDLASKLAELQPSFFRFPGGCYVEGNILTNAFRWKRSIGDTATRPGHWNGVWNYFSTDGLGFHEYLQLCEDVGAEPLFGINCGMSHSETVPLADMGPWVQDALDAIEYANGSTNTTWGALRAANGHPAPFNLKYMEIGNENGGTSYNDRYALFYDAIKAAHPDMKIIACVWGGTPTSRPFDLMDEHYYTSPATMASYATKYDSYNRGGPKVFVGEYAVTSGYGTYGNVAAALGEAAFMTGIERNSDIVELACYAPLFANVSGMQWHPNLINYDNARCFGTPAYYVQQMFSLNRGKAVLPATVVNSTNASNAMNRGAVGVGSWNTSVQYTNIVVTSNGVPIYQSDFVANGTNGWRVYKGTWSTNAGLLQQTQITTDCRATTGNTNWANYTVTLRARKVSGSEGFLILFHWSDDSNYTWWNIGGWNNTLSGIEQAVGGGKSIVGSQVANVVATNVWYDLRIVLTNSRIQCYLGTNATQAGTNLIHDVSYPAGNVIACSSYDDTTGTIIVKAVNTLGQPSPTSIMLNGVGNVATNATLIQMSAASASAENSLASPTNVAPIASTITVAGTNFSLTLPAYSITVLRLQASGISSCTNLLLQVPSPIQGGETVASTVWAQKPGTHDWVDLTSNSNHAITFKSLNPGVAVVDASGAVTGLRSGTAGIVASYGSLGLASTQSVQVLSLPVSLAHRYSFNETSGTTVADSIGGAAWDGVLPNGGTFGGGRLALSSASQQYVQLPAGILSNYTATTIEAWVTFADQLPVNCFFFGFGNINGSAGEDYIFCAPRAGRIAITDGGFGAEQNASGAGDLSFKTNLHFTAVFNPPAGYLALYTNGTLAAINSSITVPMGAVSNAYSFIARSLFSGDPYPNMALDEFRIYSGALQSDEIFATQQLGAEQILATNQPPLTPAVVGNNLNLSWPLEAAGFALFVRTNLTLGAWEQISSPAPQFSGGQWHVMVPVASGSSFYRLQK